MQKNEVQVTYYFKNNRKSDALDSAEIVVTRGWRSTGYETLESIANRCAPTQGAEWMTIHRSDKQAVTFRIEDLESIEYDAGE